MNDQSTPSRRIVPHVAEGNSRLKRSYCGLLAGLGAAFLLVSGPVLAATSPSLGSTSTYGIVSSTLTNTTGGSTITGDVCYTTGPATSPTISGATVVPCPSATGTDQGSARANLLSQSCTPLGAAVALNAITIGANLPGTFPPGCYSSTGAMSITTGTTVTLSGAGSYVFRPGGAFDPAANSNVVTTGGACASDVFWAPNGATTIGANSSFKGNILEGAGAANDITIGSTVNFEGRALAFGNTVTIDTDTIAIPTCVTAAVPVPPPVAATGIPTLSEWAMILLIALLAVTGFVAMRRQTR